MRPILILTILFAGCAGRLPAPAAPAAGWVDFGRVAAGSALGQRLTAEHAKVVKAKQAEIDEMVKLLKDAEKRAQDRAEAAAKARPGARLPPFEDIEHQRRDADAQVAHLRAEIQLDDAQGVAKLRQAIEPVAARVAEERHLATVDFTPDARLWSACDLTDEVIRRLDAGPPGKSGGVPTRR